MYAWCLQFCARVTHYSGTCQHLSGVFFCLGGGGSNIDLENAAFFKKNFHQNMKEEMARLPKQYNEVLGYISMIDENYLIQMFFYEP
jgi:hypothetical protein